MDAGADSEWIAALRSQGVASPATDELRRYLRRGLRRALAGHAVRPEDLDDFTHDALVRILEHLDEFRGDSQFRTWAMAIAVRVALSALRRRRHPAAAWEVLADGLLEALPDTPAGDPPRRVERRALLEVLATAVRDQLTDRQRLAVLGELEGVPTERLAERLGLSRNALYKLHHDARRKLRAAILAAGFTEADVREELARVSED